MKIKMRSGCFWNRYMRAQVIAVRNAYTVMQAQYVLRPEDRIDYNAAMNALSKIKGKLEKNRAWVQYKPSTELMLRFKAEEANRTNQAPEKIQKRDVHEQ